MDNVDADILLLIQLQDLQEVRQQNADLSLATDLYQDELRKQAQLITGHRLAQRVGDAHAEDSHPPSPSSSATPLFNEAIQNLTLTSNETTNESQDEVEVLLENEPGVTATLNATATCICCQEAMSKIKILTAPCNHDYCTVCINRMFELATQDESQYPPSCCGQEITTEDAERQLEEGIRIAFEAQSEEFQTGDRTYCSNSNCLAFISPKVIQWDNVSCPKCDAETCVICKAAAHHDGCPNDPAFQLVMSTAASKGFRQCHNCRHMIELSIGCFHMT